MMQAKTTALFPLLALAMLGLAGFADDRDPRGFRDVLRLKEERMTLEYTATSDEAVIRIAAESETELQRVEVLDPQGTPVLLMHAREGEAIMGFEVEMDETSLDRLLATYPEGDFPIRARSTDGEGASGMARLAHALPQPPVVLSPLPGEENVSLQFTATWLDDKAACGYVIVVEQGDSDNLVVNLPAGSTSFRVPRGVLRPGVPTQLEVGAVRDNGNTTLVEVEFTTRPAVIKQTVGDETLR